MTSCKDLTLIDEIRIHGTLNARCAPFSRDTVFIHDPFSDFTPSDQKKAKSTCKPSYSWRVAPHVYLVQNQILSQVTSRLRIRETHQHDNVELGGRFLVLGFCGSSCTWNFAIISIVNQALDLHLLVSFSHWGPYFTHVRCWSECSCRGTGSAYWICLY